MKSTSSTPRTDAFVKKLKGWHPRARAGNLAMLCRIFEREMKANGADAARYRFIRDCGHGDGALRRRVFAARCDWSEKLGGRKGGPWSQQEIGGDTLDREVDAQMRREKRGAK
jgi:hypothetical protein